ncbi:cytochrome-c peroxidase [Neptunitalea chrysea]|uniref:Cytochrome-c peroxidase n=1 Tax=Neptunitalea chrysea TaxID=1647581 RepID=A0A9W6B674_9FLAO|nr:cytochrome c peroxidase [Neptunitalea chrysea]GLB52019.1 cytochrome-c peroxidase [Neptunitalea chrysea]
MKKLRTGSVVILAIVLLSSVAFVSFTPTKDTAAKGFLLKELDLLNKNFYELDAIAEMYKNGNAELSILQSAITKSRLQYKRIEFYLEFYYPEFVKSHINGAPLLHTEVEGTNINVLTPEGLQSLDELIFSDNAYEERAHVFGLARKLVSNYSMLHKRLTENDVPDFLEIESLRLELVRIFSLGVTGFDTPGSLNALQEAAAALTGMKMYFSEVYGSDQGTAEEERVLLLFDKATDYLKAHTDFNTFDRLTFLKTYIDPLYLQLKYFNSRYTSDYLSYTASWNTQSESIFSRDFLNPYAFTGLKKEEDSKELYDLGKKLFYDPLISGDKKFSCATCHQPSKGFADGVAKSMSNVQGKTVLRNAPTLLNAVYADRYFYDLRAFTLEQQAEHVIFNPAEFNTAYSAIIKKLEASKEYVKMFTKVFGKDGVSRDNFSKALASYVLSLQSFDSDFDKYVRGEINTLPNSVKNGFNLFTGKANCATCHFSPTFSGLVPPLYNENESEILGVLADNTSIPHMLDADEGRYENSVHVERAWIYKKSFKTSTVRNVKLTGPYFHNGAYKTLEEVVDFYDQGGGVGMGLNVTNQTLPEDALNLTEQEKKDLIVFMEYLTDNSAGEKLIHKN